MQDGVISFLKIQISQIELSVAYVSKKQTTLNMQLSVE